MILSLCLVLTLFGGVSFATEGNGSKPESLKDSGTLALPEYQAPLGDAFPIVDSAAHLVITKWEWVDDAQFLTWDEGRGAYILSVPTDPENPVDKALVLDYLPTEIKATLADGTEKVLGVVWDETNLDIIDGRAWAGSYTILAGLTDSGYYLGEGARGLGFVLILDYPEALAVTADQLKDHIVTDTVDPPNTTVNLFDYWISGDRRPTAGDLIAGWKADYHHNGLNPGGYSFWATPFTSDGINKGINKDRLLLFGDAGIIHSGYWNKGAGAGADNDGFYGRLYAGMEGIVEPKLVNPNPDDPSSVEKYPVIDLDNATKVLTGVTDPADKMYRDASKVKYGCLVGDCTGTGPYKNHHTGNNTIADSIGPANSTDKQNISKSLLAQWSANTGKNEESLDYLFDPNVSHDYKESFEDVKGLFQLDSEGYYYYDMRKNFAEFDEGGTGNFILYDAPGVLRSDNINPDANGKYSTGNFLPFNKGTEVFFGIDADGLTSGGPYNQPTTGISSNANNMNHYLGMTVDVDFRQPLNGQINSGSNAQDMTFEFSGDDDVWVFVDDVLVLDIGGVHSELYGKINFSTGEVLVGRSYKTNGIPTEEQIENDRTAKADGGPRPVIETTLLELFEAAGATDSTRWNGDTFASNTSHTLKMFYMERGNYDSSLALRFNLQPLLYQQIRKVDQNGQSLKNVEFELYPARRVADGSDEFNRVEKMNAQERREAGYIECNNVRGTTGTLQPPYHYFIQRQMDSKPLTTLTTGEDGTANFEDKTIREGGERDGSSPPFNFSDRYKGDLPDGDPNKGVYYVLHESKVPDGYRTPPLDIALEFSPDMTMLTVANRWTSGAYASFVDNIQGNSTITYGYFDAATGAITPDDSKPVSLSVQHDGLILAVPMLENAEGSNWNTIYGNNIDGFNVIKTEQVTAESWRQAVLEAALYQCAYSSAADSNYPAWTMGWSNDEGRLTGRLGDLPGVANRYRLNNADGDMQMVFGVIVPQGLEALLGPGNNPADAQARYEALGLYILDQVRGGKDLKQAVSEVASTLLTTDSTETTGSGKTFSFLNVDQFSRSFRSLIYIPNEQRELRVRKIDQNNQPVEGAKFAIYKDPACTDQVSEIGETDGDGNLIFAPYVDNTAREKGLANMVWVVEGDMEDEYNDARFYLKELESPAGYQLNPTIVPIEVGYYSIYADAGTLEDGVSVMAGVGKLNQTMAKYAQDEDINITLRDITAFAQTQPSGRFDIHGWQDLYLDDTPQINRAMNLHYKLNAVVDYGLHDQDGGDVVEPFFTTDTGFLRARVRQNTKEGQAPYLDEEFAGRWENLYSTDLTNIFSLLNIVVITDKKPDDAEKGSLRISKRIIGENLDAGDYTKNFQFTISFTDANGLPLAEEFHFYGTDKEGTIQSGETMPLHHDEEIIIRGLPYGTRYTVTEAKDNEFPYTSPGLTATGQITREDPEIILPFINSKTPFASFAIRKTVTGSTGEKEKNFHFTVTIRDKNGKDLSGRYPFTGSKTGGVKSGETITLRDGQSVTIQGLPIGTSYTVVEQEANQDGYRTTTTGTVGNDLTADSTPEALFENHREPPDDPGDDDDDGDDPDPGDPTTPVTPRKTPDTGDITETGGWTFLSLAFLAGIAAILYYRWRKKKKEE